MRNSYAWIPIEMIGFYCSFIRLWTTKLVSKSNDCSIMMTVRDCMTVSDHCYIMSVSYSCRQEEDSVQICVCKIYCNNTFEVEHLNPQQTF